MIRRLLVVLLVLSACASPGTRVPQISKASAGTRTAVLLAINDVYRIEGLEEGRVAGLARVRSLRKELERDYPDLLLFHAGDFLFPSFASRMYNGEQMVAVLNNLDGNPDDTLDDRMFVVFGNHEFEKKTDASILDKRIKESRFHWLGGNVMFKAGEDGKPLVEDRNLSRTALVESGGIRIGIFGLTIPTDGIEYADFADPEATARELTAALRAQGAEVVVGLTHLNFSDDKVGGDRELLENLGDDGPDLIVGGHDHEKMVIQVGKRLVIKADADARRASVIRLTVRNGQLGVAHDFRTLEGVDPRPDPDTLQLVGDWQAKHEQEFCAQKGAAPGCLGEHYGFTRTPLEAEETKIRRQETSLGDWVADQMRKEMEPCGAQVAFINSGTLRLNQDLPGGTNVIRRHVEELFGYDTPLRLIRIDGATLQKVVDHAVQRWPASGSWLQISGFAWVHDTEKKTATGLTLLTPQGPRPVRPDEEILAAVNDYLVNEDPKVGNQDGYDMLRESQIVRDCAANGRNLKDVVKTALEAADPQGIAPKAEGRICQPDAATSACLAQAGPE